MPYSVGCAAAIDSTCRLGFLALEQTVAKPLVKVMKIGYNIAHDVGAQTYLKALHPRYAKICNGIGFSTKLITGQFFGESAWKWAAKKQFTQEVQNTLSWPIRKCIRNFGLAPIVRKHLLGYYLEEPLKQSPAYRCTRLGARLFGKSQALDQAVSAKINEVSKEIVDKLDKKFLGNVSKTVTHSIYGSIAGVASSYLWGRALSKLMGDQAGTYIDIMRWVNALGPKAIYSFLEHTYSILPRRVTTLPGIKPVVEDLRQKEALDEMVEKIKSQIDVAHLFLKICPTRPCNQESLNKFISEIALYILSNKLIEKSNK